MRHLFALLLTLPLALVAGSSPAPAAAPAQDGIDWTRVGLRLLPEALAEATANAAKADAAAPTVVMVGIAGTPN